MKFKTRTTKTDLLIGIGCILLLLANIGAVGRSGRRRAKEMVCLSNLHKWGVLFDAFTKDRNGYFMDRDAANAMIYMFRDEYDETLDERMWLCPSAIKLMSEGGVNPNMAWEDSGIHGSYVINLWTTRGDPDSYHLEWYWGSPNIPGAQYAPMLLDGQWKDTEPYPEDDPPLFETSIWLPNEQEMQRACVNRHNGGVNVLFMDFSVRKVGLKELWRLKWHREWPVMGTPENPYPDWPEWMSNFKDPN